jgi:hypothetical protein
MALRRTAAAIAIAAAAVGAAAHGDGLHWHQVSLTPAGGDPSNSSGEAAIAPNGRWIAFHSNAPDLTDEDLGETNQVYVRDLRSGTTELVSADAAGGPGDSTSRYACISNNGRWVLFESNATDLVADDDAVKDVFVADRKTGDIAKVSASHDGSLSEDDATIYNACLSGNGRWAVFTSAAENLVDGIETGGFAQVYLRDLRAGTTRLVSRNADGDGCGGTCGGASISANGKFVAFYSNAGDLDDTGNNGQTQVWVWDSRRDTFRRASVDAAGALGSSGSFDPVVSNNGRWVAFYSYASTLVPPDTNGGTDTFLKDLVTGEIRSLSGGTETGQSYTAAISASGKTVVFYSEASDLTAGDGNGQGDVFLYDVPSATLSLISADAEGNEGDDYSYMFGPSLSSNGKWLAIASDAENLDPDAPADPDTHTDVFVRKLR